MPRHVLALTLLLACSIALVACGGEDDGDVPSGAPEEASSASDEWPAPNGDLGNTRVAAGSDISSENVGDLGIAWAQRITAKGTFGGYASTPLIVDGVVYTQDLSSNVRAYSLEDGSLKWERMYDSPTVGPNGLAIGDGRIYGATIDKAFALDVESGDEVWMSEKLTRNANEGIDMAPAMYDGIVYVSTVPGNPDSFYKGDGVGVLWALDAETGEKRWTFNTVPEDLWNAELKDINSGGGLWHPPAFDGEAMYIAVANPAPWLGTEEYPWGSSRPGPNLYTNSAVRLDPETGEMAWHRQVLPHDVYDWDLHLPPIVGEADRKEVVFASGKLGRVYAINREDGSIVWENTVGRHNGHDADNEIALAGDLDQMPDLPLTLYPGILGGVETQMALDDGRLFVPIVNVSTTFKDQVTPELGLEDGTGQMMALDADDGEELWNVDLPTPAYGAATVSNDLVFTTTFDGHLRAFDVKTGESRLDIQMPAGTNATVAISGDTLVTAASFPQSAQQVAQIIAYRIGSSGSPVAAAPETTTSETEPTSTTETETETETETTSTTETETETETETTSTSTTESTTTTSTTETQPDNAAGKTVFLASCGSCHTLADAGTSGTVGPNLDELKPDSATVEEQVRNGGGGMPSFQGSLSDEEIKAVSDYVAAVAGTGGGGGDSGGSSP